MNWHASAPKSGEREPREVNALDGDAIEPDPSHRRLEAHVAQVASDPLLRREWRPLDLAGANRDVAASSLTPPEAHAFALPAQIASLRSVYGMS
jgi:hypothetical protein